MRKSVSSLLVVLIVAVPLVGIIAAIAYAADLCLTVGHNDNSGSIQSTLRTGIVVKNVGGGALGTTLNKTLAGKRGKCVSLAGFAGCTTTGAGCNYPSGFSTEQVFGTMSLCTSSDASHVTVAANLPGVTVNTQIPLPIPPSPSSNASSDAIVTAGDVTGGITSFGIPTTAAVCSPPSVPVP